MNRRSFLKYCFGTTIGGMSLAANAFAKGLKIAAKMTKDKALAKHVKARYKGWEGPLGKKIEKGKPTFAQMEKYALTHKEPKVKSGQQEMLENILNEYID